MYKCFAFLFILLIYYCFYYYNHISLSAPNLRIPVYFVFFANRNKILLNSLWLFQWECMTWLSPVLLMTDNFPIFRSEPVWQCHRFQINKSWDLCNQYLRFWAVFNPSYVYIRLRKASRPKRGCREVFCQIQGIPGGIKWSPKLQNRHSV